MKTNQYIKQIKKYFQVPNTNQLSKELWKLYQIDCDSEDESLILCYWIMEESAAIPHSTVIQSVAGAGEQSVEPLSFVYLTDGYAKPLIILKALS